MNRPELSRQLQALAHRHPGTHPYTLALRFQAQTGRILSGLQVKQLLAEPVNHSIHAAKS
ncbi:hypothetical protein KBZ14_06285 [Synechococcus sp. HJ21-Hayes]|uniref:hypothetical protein n=1 Tax=unclassified Synechococcus TaxID=2626047 RepID=UPI0020CBD60F|nr:MULTISPECIES: hypothetical protein [unclassified Synechococcus]MCP9831011.1 hypothetical protein [Synechococcus sp. JJ3a-Johnson]MCP9852479.1 hypothetical protein [Synechococcus sp. HJ21-Hayes]